jgi:general secretion pathway protein D
MQTANDARLLADPNVTVLDNEQAEWKSVSEIPYQQITQSELGGQIGTTAFKEAGISLRVRPIVAADGTIELIVEPEFSRLAGFTPNDNQPIIDTRKATTTVRVANRQTLVLGGLRQRSDNGEFNGVPFLKDLKYFGPLFRSRDTTVRESELLVFISPEIIGYDDALRPRQYQGLETIDQRLEDIPPGEGQFGPCGPEEAGSGIEGGLLTLPPVEEVPAAEPSSADGGGGTSSKAAAAPLRPPYAQRFRERR